MRSNRTTVVSSHRTLPLSLAAAVALALANQSAPAADLFWNANPTTALWNQADENWTPDSFISANWNNTTPDSAIFDGTGVAGPVTLGEDITVGNITFNAGGYTVAGGDNDYTLTLSDTTITGTASATISANLAGTTGFTVISSAASGTTTTLTLSGNNTYSGTTTVKGTTATTGAQVLRLESANALGNSDQIAVGNGSALILAVPDSVSTSVGSGKTLTIYGTGPGSNGALQGASGMDTTWAGNIIIGSGGSRISGGSSKGTLTISGVIGESQANSWVVFNRIGGSTTVLNAVNTYTGETQIFNNVGGSTSTLKIGVDNAINTSSRLATIGAASTADAVLDLNGHIQTLRGLDTAASPNATSSAFLIVKNDGGTASTLTVGDAASSSRYVFGGALRNGGSELSLVKAGNTIQVLAGVNTYTGTTTVNSGTLQVGAPAPTSGNTHYTGSNGSLASTDIRLNGGSFVVDNTGTNNNSGTRLSDSANFTLNNGTTFEFRGSELADSQETLGKFTFASGISTLKLVHGANNAAVVTAGELSRSTGGGLGFLSGADFGSTASAASRLIVSNAPTLVGTSDALPTGAGTAKDTKIVPFLLATTTIDGKADTFVTYNPTTGLRPLSLTEYEGNIAAGANVRISSSVTSGTTATINSLIVTGVSLTLTGTVKNTSGAFLFTGGTSNISGGTLDLDTAEGLMTVSGTTAVVSSQILGSKGLTLAGSGTLGLGSTSSTYTGETMLHSGIIVPQVSSKIENGLFVSGPFGKSTVVFAGSQIRTSTTPSDVPTTIANNVRIQADTTIINGGADIQFTGPVTLAGGTRTLTNSTAKNTTFADTIGDGDQDYGLTITGTGAGSVILEGENTYGGPTTVNSSTLNVSGSISGSSTVSVNNAGTLVLSGPTPFFVGRIGDSTPLTLGNAGGNGGALLKIDNSADSAEDRSIPFEETLGSLTLANNAVLDLGTGDLGSILSFAESQGSLWSGTLSIYNWTGTVGVGGGADQIFFGADQFSLTASQLAQIRFYSDAGSNFLGEGGLLNTGELIAVATIPEPSSMLSLFAMFGGLLGGRRLRRRLSVEG